MPDSRILPCPHLVQVTRVLPITHTRQHREQCSEAYYISCLELAQSLWLQGKIAQAILQLDKAMMANIPTNHEILNSQPIPYKAIVWFIQKCPPHQFMGNPVRHFQHLASRMNWKQPQPELRIVRAWLCFHLAESCLCPETFPRDTKQIDAEGIQIPSLESSVASLRHLSPHQHELAWFESALQMARS